MAAIKASEIKYGTPLKTDVGALYLTATRIELPASKEYESVLELDLSKLGLTGQQIAGVAGTLAEGLAPTAGEVATTTALPSFVWCTNLVEAKTDAEAEKEVKEAYLTQVSTTGSKLFLRVFSLPTAGDGKPVVEAKKATKITFTAAQACTVFVLGK